MQLIYIDETGNTGSNLTDSQQPVFALAALVVHECKWEHLDAGIRKLLDTYFPDRPEDFEIHAAELNSPPKGSYLRRHPIAHRLQFRDSLFTLAREAELPLVYRSVVKSRFQTWQSRALGSGIKLNPHVAVFPMLARVVDDLVGNLGPNEKGMFICDENKGVLRDIEKTILALRGMEGVLRLRNIIEKGFFVDSRKSLLLQLCDLCAFAVRRKAEAEAGVNLSALNKTWIHCASDLIVRGNEAHADVIDWLIAQ